MHELLFRGQTRKKGQKVNLKGEPLDGIWVYGGIFQGNGCYSVLYTYDPIEKRTVYSDTVGQYTGFEDKDSIKIFEDDIMMLDHCIYVIEWHNGGFLAILKTTNSTSETLPLQSLVAKGAVVIGNIHDNPDLLWVLKG